MTTTPPVPAHVPTTAAERAELLAGPIDETDGDPGECRHCHNMMMTDDGYERSALCHHCVQGLAPRLLTDLESTEALARQLRAALQLQVCSCPADDCYKCETKKAALAPSPAQGKEQL